MKLGRTLLSIVILLIIAIGSVSAQEMVSSNLFGDEQQPGQRLHQTIVDLHTNGDETAIADGIAYALQGDNTMLGAEAKQAVAFDEALSNRFYEIMTVGNSLIDTVKTLIEEQSTTDKVIHSVTLGIVLYPDFAQEVYDGALIAGALSDEDLLVAMLQAGADPGSFVEATAGGPTGAGPVFATVAPLGAGIGAGGTGGGDTTASTN